MMCNIAFSPMLGGSLSRVFIWGTQQPTRAASAPGTLDGVGFPALTAVILDQNAKLGERRHDFAELRTKPARALLRQF